MNYKQLQSRIDGIAAEYKAAASSEALEKAVKDSIYNQHGIDGLNDEELFSRTLQEAKDALRQEAVKRIDEAKESYRPEHEKLMSQNERALVRVNSGITVAERYAKTHGITLQEAQAELNAYAKVKTGNFNESTADRYAAIVNNGITEDRHPAHKAIESELKTVNLAGIKSDIDNGSHLLNQYSGSILSNYDKSGYVIARQLEKQSQE